MIKLYISYKNFLRQKGQKFKGLDTNDKKYEGNTKINRVDDDKNKEIYPYKETVNQ